MIERKEEKDNEKSKRNVRYREIVIHYLTVNANEM